jgi:membrane-bound lytic murein transglycosylase D
MNETQSNQPPQGGSKLSTIFLVVLGLHIVLIVAFSAYYLLKGDTSVKSDAPAVAEESQAAEPKMDATAQHAPPVLETEQNAHAASAPLSPATPADPAVMPMPPSNDPIWTRVPEPAPRAAEPPALPKPAVANPAPVVRTPAAAPASAAGSHTVVKGDSLAKIARIYGVSVADLKSANGLQSDLIRIGQVLSIPAASAASTTTPAPRAVPTATPVTAAPATVGSYTVAKGDTLWSISRKLGVSAQELARINGLSDPSKLKIGTVLKVPAAPAPARQEMAAPVPAPARATDMAMAHGQS